MALALLVWLCVLLRRRTGGVPAALGVIVSAAATAGVALAIATVVWGVRAARSGQLDRAAAVGLAATGPMIVVNFGLTNFGALAAGAGGVVLVGAWLFAAVRSAAQAVPAASTM